MDILIIILGILYLCGKDVGKTLAIFAIIEGSLVFLRAALEAHLNKHN